MASWKKMLTTGSSTTDLSDVDNTAATLRGELLIWDTTSSTFVTNQLNAGTGISVASGDGSVTISNTVTNTNIYTDDGTIPSGTTRKIKFANSGSSNLFFTDSTGNDILASIKGNGSIVARDLLTINTTSGTVAGASIFLKSNDDSSLGVRLRAPAGLSSSYTLTLPDGNGDLNQVLTTNGSGTLSWEDADSLQSLAGFDQVLTGDRLIDMDGNNLEIDLNAGDFTITNGISGTVIEASGLDVSINGLTYPSSDGSNGQVIKTDGSGNLSFTNLSGSSIIKHFYSGGAQLQFSFSRFLPLTGDVIEQNTASTAVARTGMIAPYDGEVKKIVARCEEVLGDTELAWFKTGDGTLGPNTSMQSVTVDIDTANTVFTYTYTTATFSKGDFLALKVDPTNDPASNFTDFNYTIEFEFDTST